MATPASTRLAHSQTSGAGQRRVRSATTAGIRMAENCVRNADTEADVNSRPSTWKIMPAALNTPSSRPWRSSRAVAPRIIRGAHRNSSTPASRNRGPTICAATNQCPAPGSSRSWTRTMPLTTGKLSDQKQVARIRPPSARRWRAEGAVTLSCSRAVIRSASEESFASLPAVILSRAKDPRGRRTFRSPEWILRCAQDDGAERSGVFDPAKTKPPRIAPRRSKFDSFRTRSDEVLADQLGHVEHADLRLATEHGLEGVVGVDHAAVLLVLKTVLLDVHPELLGELRAGEGLFTNDQGELGVGGDRLHERGVGFTS